MEKKYLHFVLGRDTGIKHFDDNYALNLKKTFAIQKMQSIVTFPLISAIVTTLSLAINFPTSVWTHNGSLVKCYSRVYILAECQRG